MTSNPQGEYTSDRELAHAAGLGVEFDTLAEAGKARREVGSAVTPRDFRDLRRRVLRSCECGRAERDLPMYFWSGNREEHMFNGCPACGVTFCTCGRQHDLRRDPETAAREIEEATLTWPEYKQRHPEMFPAVKR